MSTTNTTTIAERPSRCGDCFAFINIGDRVTRANTFTEWVHERCPKTRFDITGEDVCPECFTVRATNGACNCV